ncbi:hypothetical protein QC762_124460 [Podospora pseudocomata]|uniref:Uncharacterized protein n=1 Tax=Podospora pseudocomata TaxID=2093779 RepID=A0ABR0GZ62_9PEZI|nr:hypothetical protein QC762_124460 [Podospora pseudocomata]
MCYQLLERYSSCGCYYYRHQVDKCCAHGRAGHIVQQRTILVGHTCADHTSHFEDYGKYGSATPAQKSVKLGYSKQVEESDETGLDQSSQPSIAIPICIVASSLNPESVAKRPGISDDFAWIETPVHYDWEDSDAESRVLDPDSIISVPSTVSSVDPDATETIFHRLLHFQDLQFLWSHTVQLSGSRLKSNHNIARFLKLYAIDLLNLALNTEDRPEKRVKLDTANFVRRSRRDIARRITEAHCKTWTDDSAAANNDIIEDQEIGENIGARRDYDQGDSGPEDEPFDLVTAVAEVFLFETDPVLHLQSNVKAFVNRQCPKVVQQSFWEFMTTKTSNMVSQLRQKPLEDGKTRITWTCKCGRNLYDDFTEIVPGAVKQLEAELRYQNTKQPELEYDNLDAQNTPRSHPNSFARVLFQMWTGTTRIFRKFQYPLLPEHKSSRGNMSLELGNPCTQSSQQAPYTTHLFLLLCVPFLRFATRLAQPEVCQINSDQELFQLLRRQYLIARSGKRWLWGQLRRVQAIDFVKLELYSTQELVDICHSPSLPQDTDPYVYNPQPAEHIPPVGANHLMHLFSHPSHAEPLPILFRRVPKKVDNPLKPCPINGVGLGWSLYLQEGMNWPAMLLYGCIGFGLSLFTAVVWATLVSQGDVQGGFAIGGFMVAFLGFAGGVMAHMNGGNGL